MKERYIKIADFKENIKGKFYSVGTAKQHFIDYVTNHNGYLSDRFRRCNTEIVNGSLTQTSKALANTNLKENKIRIQKNQSIITYFHECRHLSDEWQADDGNWYGCWEYERNYDAQMQWVDEANKVVHINRGVHGKFMGEAVAELYATYMYWDMCGDKKAAQAYTAKRTEYDEEILTFKKICTVLGVDENMLLNMSSKDDYARKFIRNQCTQITGDPKYWDLLEFCLDYTAMEKFIKLSHTDFTIDDDSKKGFQVCRNKANEMIQGVLDLSRDKGFITENQYKQRQAEVNKLDEYMPNIRTI